MSKRFEARIYWLSERQGGRKEIPTSDKYAPIIKLTKPLLKSDDVWSIFVVNKNFLKENVTLSEIEYLSNLAPDNLTKASSLNYLKEVN